LKTNHTHLVRSFLLFLFSLLLIPIGAQAETDLGNDARPMGAREDKAFFRDTQLWPIDPATGLFTIPVCWEDYNESSPQNRILVQAAVENAWEGLSSNRNTGFSLVDFTGWQECTGSDELNAVKIQVGDITHPEKVYGLLPLKSPYVEALGVFLKGNDHGVVLNFTMTTESHESLMGLCNNNLRQCIKATAVHEFGHVLGMSHENNRSDKDAADPDCASSVISDPDFFDGEPTQGLSYFTDYDKKTIMNYCNKDRYRYGSGLFLTPTSRLAVKAHYGEIPSFDVRTGILTIPRVELKFTTIDGFYNAKLKHVADPDPNIIRLKLEGSVAKTTKPSTATALFSNANLVLPLLKIIGPSGHIDQIAESINFTHQPDGTFTLNEGLQQLINNRVQPLTFEPGSKY